MATIKTDKIWAVIELCFPIDDTIWIPGSNITLYDEIALILGEEDIEEEAGH